MRSLALIAALAATPLDAAMAQPAQKPEGAIRIAAFNAAMARKGAGALIADFAKDHPQIANVVEIVLRARPDILLINEIDADPAGKSVVLLAERLAAGMEGLPGLTYAHLFQGPQNVGVFSGLDLDRDGKAAGPADAWGYGRFPGQFAMAVLSRFPIDRDGLRSYGSFRWAEMPKADRPANPDGTPFHPEEIWQVLRLSSKNHWDLPIALPDGRVLHLLAAHPTPPVFDGPEDRNGRRNADEIRLLTAMIDGADWLRDDRGRASGLPADAPFVVAGDLNADPEDGEGHSTAIRALLTHPRVQDPKQTSPGAAEAGTRPDAHPRKGDPARHTGDWPEGDGEPGNLRVDYVLPSRGLEVLASGVFWPVAADPLARLVKTAKHRHASSDHRLVWVDIAGAP